MLTNNEWHKRWETGDTKFHQSQFNQALCKKWDHLDLPPNSVVFVPLCGKSRDMIWLLGKGYQVIGVELSDIACKAFFEENNLDYEIKEEGKFRCYVNQNIRIYCGDIFNLTENQLIAVNAVYDRAALVALPTNVRTRYIGHLKDILPQNVQFLLIVLSSPDNIQGPPYSIDINEARQLFAPEFIVIQLSEELATNIPEHIFARGYSRDNTYEAVYLIKSAIPEGNEIMPHVVV